MRNKKAAMEMSVGTIVTIVLLMSVLVLGIFLVQKIFQSANGALDLTDQQLNSEIEKLFSEETQLVIYPSSKYLEIKVGETEEIGIGIRNIARIDEISPTFSYSVISNENDCNLDDSRVEEWIRLGKSEEGIPIGVGNLEVARITFRIPEGTPLCLARFRVSVEKGSTHYATETFTIEVK